MEKNSKSERHTKEDPALRAILDNCCRHLVMLNWIDVRVQDVRGTRRLDPDPQNCFASAFILSINNQWYLATAGHILRDLEERLASGRRLVASNLMDGIASGRDLEPIPFDLDPAKYWFEYNENEGIDYALLPLREGFVRPLKSVGVQAIDESYICGLDTDATEFYLLGVPYEVIKTTSHRANGRVHFSTEMGTPLLPLKRVLEPPVFMRKAFPRFYAKVPCDNAISKGLAAPSSIEGMSGGPIIAVKRTSPTSGTYWLLGIQSCWDPKSRIIAANPALPLIHLLRKKEKKIA